MDRSLALGGVSFRAPYGAKNYISVTVCRHTWPYPGENAVGDETINRGLNILPQEMAPRHKMKRVGGNRGGERDVRNEVAAGGNEEKRRPPYWCILVKYRGYTVLHTRIFGWQNSGIHLYTRRVQTDKIS